MELFGQFTEYWSPTIIDHLKYVAGDSEARCVPLKCMSAGADQQTETHVGSLTISGLKRRPIMEVMP